MKSQLKVKKVSVKMNGETHEFSYFLLDPDDRDQMIYSPLTCELCSETFTVPAEWVRHIESHAESTHCHVPKKRKRLDLTVSRLDCTNNRMGKYFCLIVPGTILRKHSRTSLRPMFNVFRDSR